MACAGLRSLASFRDRGGAITVLAGNHDAWLGPFYERTFGARFLPDCARRSRSRGSGSSSPTGTGSGPRPPGRRCSKSRAFLAAFRRVPAPLADALGAELQADQLQEPGGVRPPGLDIYRKFAGRLAGDYDLVILGHVHSPLDTAPDRPRLVVLGGWHARSCYLVIEEGVASHVVEPAGACV